MNFNALVIESDPEVANLLLAELTSSGFNCWNCNTAEQARAQIFARNFALLCLDYSVFGTSSRSICREFRQQFPNRTLIVSAPTAAEGIQALESGADDFLCRPFSNREYLARIRSRMPYLSGESTALSNSLEITNEKNTIGSNAENDSEKLVIGELVFDNRRRRVARGGKRIHLTAREYKLLFLLARNAGRVFERDELLTEIWGVSNSTYDPNLTVACSRIRKKIEDDPAKPEYLLTLRGAGYLFAEQPVDNILNEE